MTGPGTSPNTFVVLIKNDAAVRRAIHAFLSASGVLVAAAQDAEEAIRAVAAAALRPDVLIVNYRLTGGTALDAAPKVQQTLSLSLPVIVTLMGWMPPASE